jgi:hypothetical protein
MEQKKEQRPRTLDQYLAGIQRALDQFLVEHPDISRAEAVRMFKAAGAF